MEKYIIKAYDFDGNFYGYFAKHPDDPENKIYSYYVNERSDARQFDSWGEADCIIERFEDASELEFKIEQYVDERKYTKGMCYALCEFLETLTKHNKDVIADIADALDTDGEYYQELLERLSSDINAIICAEQNQRDDTDQMAQIMELKHIAGHKDQ